MPATIINVMKHHRRSVKRANDKRSGRVMKVTKFSCAAEKRHFVQKLKFIIFNEIDVNAGNSSIRRVTYQFVNLT